MADLYVRIDDRLIHGQTIVAWCPTLQIKEIVAEIGYIDVANFVRKFKGYEGVTPGQYRDKMRI